MGTLKEFMDFLKKYQVIGLAVAFVMGAAATALVNAVVKDLVMPIIAVLVPGGDWQKAMLQIGPINFGVGDFVAAIVNFLIIAVVVFLIVKMIMKEDATAKR